MTPSQAETLDVIVSYCHDEGGVTVATIASETHRRPDMIRKDVRRLRELGYVEPDIHRPVPPARLAAWPHLSPQIDDAFAFLVGQFDDRAPTSTHDLARRLRTTPATASRILCDLRRVGVLEPAHTLWPTASGRRAAAENHERRTA